MDKFSAWLRSRGAIPTVVALRQRFDQVRRAELERLTASLPPEVRDRVDDITRLVVEKLLLTPTEQLKVLSDAETVSVYSEALQRLFALDQAIEAPKAEGEEKAAANRRVQPFRKPGAR